MARAVLGLCCLVGGSYVAINAWIDAERASAPPIPRPIAPGWGTT